MLRMGPTSRTAHDALKNQGFTLPARPAYDMPTLPEDLTSLGDPELMGLYSRLTAWSDYLSVQLACAASDEKSSETRLDVMHAKAMITATSGGSNVTSARASVKADQSILDAKQKVHELEAYRRLTEALYNSLERDTQLISRELTRRTAHHPRERFLT